MQDVAALVDGYRRFLDGRFTEEAALYKTLGETGQSPKVMVVSCCDSRVAPEAIFSAGPGELFIVRNVANIVPASDAPGSLHGTAAALEFAVTGLGVDTILVLGHSQCGGVKGFLAGLHQESEPSFVGRWVKLLEGVPAEDVPEEGSVDPDARQLAMEQAAIRHSIRNLMTFSFIQERVADGRLRLRGAHFDIAKGRLLGLDNESGNFEPVEA